MDDDIVFYYNNAFTPSWMKSMSPLRAFENFLLEYEPALGVTNYVIHHTSDFILAKMKTLCKANKNQTTSTNNAHPDAVKNHTLYLTSTFFDACVTAFHKDAIDHILPYPTTYDQINWHLSQRYVIIATEIKFRGHCYLFTPLNTNNPKHREYPNGGTDEVLSTVAKNLASGIPLKYQNVTWVKDFVKMKEPLLYTENTPAMCLKFPPRHPIIPYSHFSFNHD
jgi:hypothetical protein